MAHLDDPHTRRANLDYIRDAMDVPLLEKAREMELARAWRDKRDERAMQEIINAYRRLVVAMASKFKHYGLPLGDLMQEGNIGLLEAVNRFDPERDIRFSTYASWWIRSCMQDYVLRNWSIVRTGTTSAQKSLFFNLRRLKAKLAQGAEASAPLSPEHTKKIATDLGVSEQDVADMDMRMASGDQSLNMTIGADGETELQSLVASDAPNPEDVVLGMRTSETRSKWLNEALSALSDRERQIIRERHLSDEPVTLDELGRELGVSKERVRQLETRAMERLRASMLGRVRDSAELYTSA
ncbi:MAG: RNA polymerase factor sigma-32 [Alphaproteobacteria bacterium]|nr:RNA polymerase factor sigma-32 [Alphaproteobacteria bacterium]